ncbi:MAG: heparinase II/III family protein [Lentisphaeria bacterium]|nr:heparinase II/III family protein [Lentisphaeria bacterium]
MITRGMTRENLASLLLSRAQWRPFPPRTDRDAWEALPGSVRAALLAEGERALGEAWPAIPAHLAMEYVRSGNRSVYEQASFPRRSMLAALVLAECVEGRGRFAEALVDAVWSICEESFWGVSAHIPMQKAGAGLPDTSEPVVDLFAAETGALLAWTVYLLGDLLGGVSPLVAPRIVRETVRRILDPCLARDDFWWMGNDSRRGLNNWTPWICSNWLATALLLEEDADRRAEAAYRAMTCVDRYLEGHPADGGCDEGPGYWCRAGASTFEFFETLASGTGGGADFLDLPLVRNMGAFLYRVHIDRDWYVNFADGAARQAIPAGLVLRFGRAVGDDRLLRLGAYARSLGRDSALKWRISLPRSLGDLFGKVPAAAGQAPAAPHVRDAWLPDLQVMTARSFEGSCAGFFVAAKGGHNAESHNHNDVGNVIVFLDGRPVLVDPGVGTYTAKTFSSRRYEIWTMQSAYHNLPSFGGVQQMPGRRAEAQQVSYRPGDEEVVFALDAARAYPAEAGVLCFLRTLVLRRSAGEVEIRDAYRFGRPVEAVLSLMTPCAVRLAGPGVAELVARDGDDAGKVRAVLRHAPADVRVECEPVPTEDGRLQPVWPEGLTRVLLGLPAATESGVRLVLCRPGGSPGAGE